MAAVVGDTFGDPCIYLPVHKVGGTALVCAYIAYVAPVAVLRVIAERHLPPEHLRKHVLCKIHRLSVRDKGKDLRGDDVDAGVGKIAAAVDERGLFGKSGDHSVFADYNAVFTRVVHRLDHDRGFCAGVFVVLIDRCKVKIAHCIAAYYDEVVVKVGGGFLYTAGSAEGRVLVRYKSPDGAVISVAERGFDTLSPVSDSHRRFGAAVLSEKFKNVEQHRLSAYRDKRFRKIAGERTETCTFSSRKNNSFHKVPP